MLSQKVKEHYHNGGLRGVFLWSSKAVYKKSIRRFMPYSGYLKYNGIDIGKKKRYGDDFISRMYLDHSLGDIATYENALVRALNEHVRAGDQVVVVGGGVGVTVTHAAIRAGEDGRVDCFEGDINGVESVKVTAHRNGVSARVHVHHAIVGDNIAVYGDSGDADCIAPPNLPMCDVLELDCEGSEIGILSQLSIRPRCIAVETHGGLGAPSEKVRELLVQRGYEVQDFGPAEPYLNEHCVVHDVMVLVGTRVD